MKRTPKMHNAELLKKNAELQAKLERVMLYAAHKRMCNLNMTNATGGCDCGLEALLKEEDGHE